MENKNATLKEAWNVSKNKEVKKTECLFLELKFILDYEITNFRDKENEIIRSGNRDGFNIKSNKEAYNRKIKKKRWKVWDKCIELKSAWHMYKKCACRNSISTSLCRKGFCNKKRSKYIRLMQKRTCIFLRYVWLWRDVEYTYIHTYIHRHIVMGEYVI